MATRPKKYTPVKTQEGGSKFWDVMAKETKRRKMLTEKPAWLTGAPYTDPNKVPPDTLRFEDESKKIDYMQRFKELNKPEPYRNPYQEKEDSLRVAKMLREESGASKEMELKEQEMEHKKGELELGKERARLGWKEAGIREKELDLKGEENKYKTIIQLRQEGELYKPKTKITEEGKIFEYGGDPKRAKEIDTQIRKLEEELLDVKRLTSEEWNYMRTDIDWPTIKEAASQGIKPAQEVLDKEKSFMNKKFIELQNSGLPPDEAFEQLKTDYPGGIF